MELQDINKEYEKLKQTYKLPEFQQLAEDFDIEKVTEKESSFLLREIRRMVSEKLSAYMHLFETLLNPTTPPMFIFTIIKNSNEKEKETIKEVYKKLAKLQLHAIKLDTIYNEKSEADFIIKSNQEWKDAKQKAHDLFEQFETKFEENNNSGRKGYFG
ncbi:hypothetical protein CMI37_38170 [Candidatus Pacearchaeota archaeon]|nr:hypothetical protein [Candidatus Pacearchaeota archaeon]|tara:strand:+ start:173 stop:646 length:474 start_codon:yes stop_codon:yes gene_type:complete